MGRQRVLRQVVGWVAVLVSCSIADQAANAAAFNYYYDDAARFALYGQQDNFTG